MFALVNKYGIVRPPLGEENVCVQVLSRNRLLSSALCCLHLSHGNTAALQNQSLGHSVTFYIFCTVQLETQVQASFLQGDDLQEKTEACCTEWKHLNQK